MLLGMHGTDAMYADRLHYQPKIIICKSYNVYKRDISEKGHGAKRGAQGPQPVRVADVRTVGGVALVLSIQSGERVDLRVIGHGMPCPALLVVLLHE